MKKITAFALVVSLIALTASGCGRSRGDNLAERGVSAFESGEYEEALDYLLRAEKYGLNRYSETKLYYNLGGVKYKLGDYEGSIEAYKKAVEKSPEHFDSWASLAVAYEKVGDRDAALECYNTALLYDPEDYSSIIFYMNLGNFYIAQRKPFHAVQILEKAMVLDEARAVDPSVRTSDRNPVIFAWLSIAYALDFQYEKSDVAFDRAVNLGFSNPNAVREQIEAIKSARS